MTLLDSYTAPLKVLCESHKVKALYAFGSVLTDKFTTDSDVDMVVSFNDMDIAGYADNYFDLKFSLEELLKRPVDLLEEQAIRNPLFKNAIESQKQAIYAH